MATLRYRTPTGEWSALSGASILDDLNDVDTATTPAAEGAALAWDSTVSQWIPQAVWKSWSGTEAEYNAIPTKDPATLYCVI